MTGVRIGVDVGGTNTDAVAIGKGEILTRAKTPTTPDVLSGVVESVRHLLSSGVEGGDVEAVMIGTTHFTNAVVEARDLAPTGVIRMSGPATRAVPPMLDWPDRLRHAVGAAVFFVGGGHEYDGREISAFDADEVGAVARSLGASGIESIAVSAVFSPVRDEHERLAADLLAELLPEAAVSRSAEIGRLGLVERENATILNAALRPLAARIVKALDAAIVELGMEAPLYLSQNDGTLMASDYTSDHPVATFASGPTNSMRGAGFLSELRDCAVIDIGGTTTDLGTLKNGFPREAPIAVDIGGVRTNFRMPDLVSVGIGGGSIVRGGDDITVGPDSVGYRLTHEALVFGGGTLTATDVVVSAGLAEVGDPTLVGHLDPGFVAEAVAVIHAGIAGALDRIKTGPGPVPVVLVGGGSILLGDELAGAERVVRPPGFEIANAIGAAMSQVGGQVDRIVTLEGTTRAEALHAVKTEAMQRCTEAGALPGSVDVVEVDEVPLAYLPSNAVRITVRAIGDLE